MMSYPIEMTLDKSHGFLCALMCLMWFNNGDLRRWQKFPYYSSLPSLRAFLLNTYQAYPSAMLEYRFDNA